MKYMLMVCVDGVPEPEADREVAEKIGPWLEEMDGRGVRLEGHQLESIDSATTVRVRDGQIVVTDGPFAETKEYIAGYDVLECANLDEAIEVAAKHPIAKYGTIEVRPFMES
jgi:hypothetical protein